MHVVARGPSLATKGFQMGNFSQFGLHLHLFLLSLLIMMLGYLRAQEIRQKKGKWWPWCSVSLIWDEPILCCRWCCLWEEWEKAVCTSLRNCHCKSGGVNPNSCINRTLAAVFPWSLKHSAWVWFVTFLQTAPQDSLWCRTWRWEERILYAVLCISTHIKQFRMKGVGSTRYHQHFVSRMSLLDWNWWTCAKRCGESVFKRAAGCAHFLH